MSDSKKIDAWPTFFKCYNRLHELMELKIKEAGLPSLEIYDVLWILEKSPEHRLRFIDLGEKVYLSRSNVTRLCERLEEQGLIERTKCPSDKRGVFAELTEKGLKTRKDIWKIYGQLIQDLFSSKLNQSEHKELIRILKNVWDKD